MEIKLTNITKDFSGKKVLEGVSLVFSDKKIHALVGENGAGKSTLASILAGSLEPSLGEIEIDGKKVDFKSPAHALKRGIVMVAQRPLLADSLSARENIFLALQSQKKYSLTKLLLTGKNPPQLEELKNTWCPDLNLDSKVKDLGGNFRFYVSLLSALMLQPRCLILDEPSVFLDNQQRESLYQRLEKGAEKGMTIIVITHSKAEAQKNCHTITFLQDGKVSDIEKYWKKNQEGENSERSRMAAYGEDDSTPALYPPCLSFDHISCKAKNRALLLDASILVNYGQITAISGMKEAALDTLEDIITGFLWEGARGQVTFWTREGKMTKLSLAEGKYSSRFLRANKTAIVPSDRVYRSSHPRLTIRELLSVYDKKLDFHKVDALIKEAQVNITRDDYASSLSGGMLQRLLLTRELSIDPDLVILCNPLQGLDLKAQRAMTEKISSLAKSGKALLIVGSSDFPLTLCQRVYTMEGGVCSLSFEGGLLD